MSDALIDAVQAELATLMVPWPDDFMEDMSPPAALLFLRQTAMATLKVIAGGALSLEEDGDEPSPTVTEVLNGVAACIAGATHSCVALELLPVEAEEALERASEAG